MENRLWVLDLASDTLEGRPAVAIWLKAEDGSTWLLKKRYTPSFYLVGDLEKAAKIVEAEGIRAERCTKKIRGSPVEALKLYVDLEDLDEYASKLLKRLEGVEAYEEDLRLTAKFLLETGLKPCSWASVEHSGFEEESGIRVITGGEIKALEHAPPPRLRVMAIDFVVFAEKGSPNPGRDPIRLISLCFDDGSEFQLEGEEREILKSLVSVVGEKDPDVIVGFGTNSTYWSYLSERAKKLGVKPVLGRLGAEPRTSIHGHVSIRGRLNIDLEDMAREIPELTVETLEEFVGYLGIEAKLDTVEEYELAERWRSDRDAVKRYSMQRAKAILKSFEAVRDFVFNLSELTSMPADFVLAASAGFRVENYLMTLAVKVGELIPKRAEITHVSYPGGLVKAPKRGLHESVAVLDFRSMYPSLMIKYNISFDTLSENGENVAPNGYRFKAEPEGFLPHALKTLLKERRKIQEKLKQVPEDSVEARVLDARQRAVKIIANAIYGYTGWVGARWYTREVAEATTAWGREVISSTIKKAEDLGMTVIYSDTDSVFLKNYEGRLEKLVEWIEKDLGLEAKLEKVFKRIIFTEAKKRYAGITTDGKLEIVGLEAVRGDWSAVAREAQRETVKTLLETGDPGKALAKAREYVRKLKRGEVELKKLIIWRQITRPLSEYSATQPHITVAKTLIKEGWKIQPGDKVGYIITKGSGPLYARVKPYFQASADEVDWSYYIEKQVVPACGRVLGAVGIKPDKISETGESTLMEFFG
ncbi:MAG: DNA polymerase II [Thaumarchaeota archaeon]|nr:DNA polymerase II [Nitrososphaerota archaeon]